MSDDPVVHARDSRTNDGRNHAMDSQHLMSSHRRKQYQWLYYDYISAFNRNAGQFFIGFFIAPCAVGVLVGVGNPEFPPGERALFETHLIV